MCTFTRSQEKAPGKLFIIFLDLLKKKIIFYIIFLKDLPEAFIRLSPYCVLAS